MKVLFVDDDPFMRGLVEGHLNKAGYDVSLCSSVDDAWQAYKSDCYDLIITDIVMPQQTGIDFMQRLQEDENKTPVLAVTAGMENSSADYANMASFFADSVMEKPLRKDDFLQIVHCMTRGEA